MICYKECIEILISLQVFEFKEVQQVRSRSVTLMSLFYYLACLLFSFSRISLDDKLYQRDLEVALALSVKENSANILDVQNSEEQGYFSVQCNILCLYVVNSNMA